MPTSGGVYRNHRGGLQGGGQDPGAGQSSISRTHSRSTISTYQGYRYPIFKDNQRPRSGFKKQLNNSIWANRKVETKLFLLSIGPNKIV